MRVLTGVRRKLDPASEDGAVIVITVLTIVVLFAMLVLTVDVGGLLLRRRGMVNAADSAALAAAKTCSSNRDTTAPETRADEYAVQNVSGASGGITQVVGCKGGSGYVTVRYESPQPLFFAGVLGFGSSGQVSASATAAWGAAHAATPIPILVYESQLTACGIPDTPPPAGSTTPCTFTYNKDTLGPPNWNYLDLSTWGTAEPGDSCHVSAAELKGIIDDGGWPTPLELNYPDPTPICVDNGKSVSVDMALVGGTFTFPVVEDPAGPTDQLNVVGFVKVHVDTLSHSPTVILTVQWSGPEPGGEGLGGRNFGLTNIRLCDRSLSTCPGQ